MAWVRPLLEHLYLATSSCGTTFFADLTGTIYQELIATAVATSFSIDPFSLEFFYIHMTFGFGSYNFIEPMFIDMVESIRLNLTSGEIPSSISIILLTKSEMEEANFI